MPRQQYMVFSRQSDNLAPEQPLLRRARFSFTTWSTYLARLCLVLSVWSLCVSNLALRLAAAEKWSAGLDFKLTCSDWVRHPCHQHLVGPASGPRQPCVSSVEPSHQAAAYRFNEPLDWVAWLIPIIILILAVLQSVALFVEYAPNAIAFIKVNCCKIRLRHFGPSLACIGSHSHVALAPAQPPSNAQTSMNSFMHSYKEPVRQQPQSDLKSAGTQKVNTWHVRYVWLCATSCIV
jgi:hypothetical protein